ncbi:four and a half LIM domains protein 5 [Notechis scutatus]|uniref:Four and a half LIM domains protein 5 n=1 Tax=Notechis scutatus TaxID=8663 RepID=A0A6J1U344_9SAUR|nr:four and a half LIM domains protein 5 [Notechis scutatus]
MCLVFPSAAASKGFKMATGQSNCFHCKDSLCGKRYIMKEENVFCVKCYDSLFANFCEKCHKAIECDSKDLAYKGCHWHETCFKCAQCHHSLVEKPFAAKDERLLCTTCYSNEYSSKCFHCKRTIMPGKITGSWRWVVTNGGVTYHDQPWHKECFLCTGCKKQLAEHRFMSKDEHPFCLECFSGHFAKKCVACTEPITALGGGKFISFEEHQWHSDCFKCSRCACSLVGKNFLTQQDQVLCCNCGSSI